MLLVIISALFLYLIFLSRSILSGRPTEPNTFSYWIKYGCAYVLLRKLKKKNEPLFDHDVNSDDIGKRGVTSTQCSWEKECPRKLPITTADAIDQIGVWGGDKEGNFVLARLTRRHGRCSEVVLYLMLGDTGEVFQLPALPDARVYNTGECTFSASGLTFAIHEPLRRCRITFNGLLRKMNTETFNNEDGMSELLNVQFIFTWHPFSFYYVYNQDFDVSALAHCLAQQPWSSEFLRNFKLSSDENYEQWGHLIGSLNIEGREERKLILRGSKERKYGKLNWSSIQEMASFKGLTEKGNGLHIEINNSADGIRNVIDGHLCPACRTKLYPVTGTDMSPKKLFSNSDDPSVNPLFSFNFTTAEQAYSISGLRRGRPLKVMEGESWSCEQQFQPCQIQINGVSGFGIVETCRPHLGACPLPERKSLPFLHESRLKCNRFVVTFKDLECQNSNNVGGKGASLALMTALANDQNKFTVPFGLCVTNAGFMGHFSKNVEIQKAVERIEEVAYGKREGNLQDECETAVDIISKLPMVEAVKSEILIVLGKAFGEFQHMRFAVRSSALGEDGEEMSAAGQNETFLGTAGFENICEAVQKCWASQFSFRSIEYKRQNGQPLNGGIGVVIQQMVAADVAGVLFTRHPLTGSTGYIYITSNYGLGESVVSATADPDTVIVQRNWDDSVVIKETLIGAKTVQVIMSGDGRTVETKVDSSKTGLISVSTENILHLCEVAIFLEKSFGSARDTEWAFHENLLYLLQSRPITTEQAISDFEIYHEFDTGMVTENEQYTIANIGEVNPGALTALSITCSRRLHWACIRKAMQFLAKHNRYDPTSMKEFGFFYNHIFFDRVTQREWLLESKKSMMSKSMEVGFYGRVIEDTIVDEIAKERFKMPSIFSKLMGLFFQTMGMFSGGRTLKVIRPRYENFQVHNQGSTTAFEAYTIIGNRMLDVQDLLVAHIQILMASNMWTMVVLSSLSGGDNEFTLDHYHDFAILVGSSNGIESGDVPSSLQKLADAIVRDIGADKFLNFTPENGLQWLSEHKGEPGDRYKEFIRRHGHRGRREFEMRCPSWAMEQSSLFKVLQTMVKNPLSDKKEESSLEEIFAKLRTPMSSFRRKILKLIIMGCRSGVVNRECGKSLLIKVEDCLRRSYHHLADLMVREGYLPDKDLMFFFTHEEIGQILHTRSAALISRGKRRRRAYPYMDGLHFHELCSGLPVPIEEEVAAFAARDKEDSVESTVELKAYPVCQGVVKSVARVVLTLEEASEIQAGDILITHATDIGWSPYFPMLSGVVTEIGGLISHGAVVAREYGLPCLVGAQLATHLFKSGDLVLLDGNKGTIKKLIS